MLAENLDASPAGIYSFHGRRFAHAFQPIVDAETKTVVSQEVLVRGADNCGAAALFEQIAEQVVQAFDQYSRECALMTASSLGLDCCINLNISPGSLLVDDGSLLDRTLEAARQHGIAPNRLVLEITESEAVEQPQVLAKNINRMRQTGARFAIDDFGAGYAGLNMLVEIQPEFLKLDRHLVDHIDQHGPRQAIVRAVVELAGDLGIELVAEGVEREQEYAFLANLGIRFYQGFLFAKPGFISLPDASFWR